jgi:hypothetical protein
LNPGEEPGSPARRPVVQPAPHLTPDAGPVRFGERSPRFFEVYVQRVEADVSRLLNGT